MPVCVVCKKQGRYILGLGSFKNIAEQLNTVLMRFVWNYLDERKKSMKMLRKKSNFYSPEKV